MAVGVFNLLYYNLEYAGAQADFMEKPVNSVSHLSRDTVFSLRLRVHPAKIQMNLHVCEY